MVHPAAEVKAGTNSSAQKHSKTRGEATASGKACQSGGIGSFFSMANFVASEWVRCMDFWNGTGGHQYPQ